MTDPEMIKFLAEEAMGAGKNMWLWQDGMWWRYDSEKDIVKPWDPLTCGDDRDMLVEAMLDANEYLQFTHERYTLTSSDVLPKRLSSAMFWQGTRPSEEEETIYASAQRAVCEAAVKAILDVKALLAQKALKAKESQDD